MGSELWNWSKSISCNPSGKFIKIMYRGNKFMSEYQHCDDKTVRFSVVKEPKFPCPIYSCEARGMLLDTVH